MYNLTLVVPNSFVVLHEQLGADNVTVHLEWSQEAHVSYSLAISPILDRSARPNVVNSSVQLMVPYNTTYSVRLVASLCGQNSTTQLELLYGEYRFQLWCKGLK